MTQQRRLATWVEVGGTWYGPDDDVPADVAEQIVNPKAWAGTPAQGSGEPDTLPARSGTMAGVRLARHVDVAGTVYGPDDAVPDDVAARITNPAAWAGRRLPAAAARVAREQSGPHRAPVPPRPGSGPPVGRAGTAGHEPDSPGEDPTGHEPRDGEDDGAAAAGHEPDGAGEDPTGHEPDGPPAPAKRSTARKAAGS